MQIIQQHYHLILLFILLIECLYYIMNAILLFSFLCSVHHMCFIEVHSLRCVCLNQRLASSLKMTCSMLNFDWFGSNCKMNLYLFVIVIGNCYFNCYSYVILFIYYLILSYEIRTMSNYYLIQLKIIFICMLIVYLNLI